MRSEIEKVPIIIHPRLLDSVIGEIQQGLFDKLPWLSYSFGKAQRLHKKINGRSFFFPSVYSGGNEYISVFPDYHLGNFSFFKIEDPQLVETYPNIKGLLKVNASIIFWFNIESIPQVANRNIELIKEEILNILNGGILIKKGRFSVTKIYELAENIYSGYSHSEIENQYLMHPYAGLKFSGNLIALEDC